MPFLSHLLLPFPLALFFAINHYPILLVILVPFILITLNFFFLYLIMLSTNKDIISH